MKLINNIISRLSKGQYITPDESRVVAFMLKEMMSRDENVNGIMEVQMSQDMYERFVMYAYTRNGTYKTEVLEK